MYKNKFNGYFTPCQSSHSKITRAGFTIVELITVIAVIGILTTIMIFSYSGISNSSKTLQAMNNAETVKKVAEAYKLSYGRYPDLVSTFSDGKINKLSDDIILLTGSQTLATNKSVSEILWKYDGSIGASTGGTIQYWDFSTNAISTNILKVGTGIGVTEPAS